MGRVLAWIVRWLGDRGESGEKDEIRLLCCVQEAVGCWGLSGSLEGSGHGRVGCWLVSSATAGEGVRVQAQGLRQACCIAGRVGMGLWRGQKPRERLGVARRSKAAGDWDTDLH